MRKTRLTIALMTALLSVGTLSGCDDENEVVYSPSGTLIKYTVGEDKQEFSITAKDIFDQYYNDSDKYQSIFDAIKSIIIRNYFTIEETVKNAAGETITVGKNQLEELKINAKRKVEDDRHQAQLNAKKNSTTLDTEWDSILESKGVETEDELFEKYLDEEKTSKFDENYYKYHIDEVKNGYVAADSSEMELKLAEMWKGYFKEMAPYHVSHILVKLEDSSATNYYNGTVSQENCEKLNQLMNAFKEGTKSFQYLAKFMSDDTGSAEKGGDLGIMDYSTSFVPEFKLGVYAYENLFGKSTEAAASSIKIPTDGIKTSYKEAALENENSFGLDSDEIPTVNANIFKDLFDARTLTTTEDEESVMDDSTLVYPRNLIYNKYLNRHSFAFVVDSTATNLTTTTEGKTGYHEYVADDGIPGLVGEGKILSTVVAGKFRPILMVRAGTSDYQGIHFIVVNRDPFTATENGTTLDEYYTTYEIGKDGYPTGKQTYVSFNGLNGDDSESRVTSFNSTLKSFNSDKLSKFIFLKYMEKEQVEIKDDKLNDALMNWIDKSIHSAKNNNEKSWEKTWAEYISTLRKQNDSRENVMSLACRVGFDKNAEEVITLKAFKEYLDSSKFDNVMTTYEKEMAVLAAVKSCSKTNTGYWEEKDLPATYADDKVLGDIVYCDEEDKYYIVSGTEANKELAETNLSSLTFTISDLYNVKGALCNDGKTHK